MKQQINHICKIMSKRHNILLAIASFFMSSAGKIEGVREFKINFSSSWFTEGNSLCKNHTPQYSSFQRKRDFVFLR